MARRNAFQLDARANSRARPSSRYSDRSYSRDYGSGYGRGYGRDYDRSRQYSPMLRGSTPDLRGIFSSVDKDGSGRISESELQRALGNGSWRPFNPDTVRLMIQIFDADGSGTIDFREFSDLWKFVSDWADCFREFDRDNSGDIDRRELQDALTRFGYRLSSLFYERTLRKFDRSQTGRVKFDDFIHLCVVLQTLTAAFRDRDTNRDGVITIAYEDYLTMVASKLFN